MSENMNSQLKGILKNLTNHICEKRKGTRNFFYWRPYQKKLEKLVGKSELSQQNYNQINRLMNKLKIKTQKLKFQNGYGKKKQINNIKKNVTKYKNYKNYKNTQKNSDIFNNMNLALKHLYIENEPKLSNACRELVDKTVIKLVEQKVIVYSDKCSKKTIYDHLNHRVPTYFGGNLFENEINDTTYKKLINGNSVTENNEELEKIEMQNKFLNYVVVGEMKVINPKSQVNYHAVHAFGVNFESQNTVDYRQIWLKENNLENYMKKIQLLYRNIFQGVEIFNRRFGQNKDYSIILPAIGMGAFINIIGRTNQQKLIQKNIDTLIDIINNTSINKSKKVYLRFRNYPYFLIKEKIKNDQNLLNNINIEGDDIFEKSDVIEPNQYFVNAWDTRSFIGNKLNQDPTIDGWFVAGYRFNKKLINNSYLHNKVIFNPEQALIITN
jgi:hypothetical protein